MLAIVLRGESFRPLIGDPATADRHAVSLQTAASASHVALLDVLCAPSHAWRCTLECSDPTVVDTCTPVTRALLEDGTVEEPPPLCERCAAQLKTADAQTKSDCGHYCY